MIYTEKLIKYEKEVKNAVDKLFLKAFKCQSDPNDLLLIIIHGFFDKDIYQYKKGKFSPYVFGSGKEGLMDDNHSEFFTQFVSGTINGDSKKHREYFKSQNNWRTQQSINTQLELMVYLKFWESEWILKQIYNLCRLIHGEPYDWHKNLTCSRKTLIENDIKGKCRLLVPKFSELIEKIYIRQIRNAAAHSQFWIAGDYLNLFNDDPPANFHLKSITIEEWEIIFHKTLLLQNFLLVNFEEYHKQYFESAKDKHFGHRLRIMTLNNVFEYKWLRLYDQNNKHRPWMWYDNFYQHYLKKFYILKK